MTGDLNVVAVGWADATSSVSSVTDSTGNIYTRAVGPTANGSIQQSIYYARNIAAGNNTVTATFNQSAAYPDIRIVEYSGLDPNTPLDVTAAATGTGTSANSGAATTTSSNELLFGAGSTAGDFVGAGTGFNSRIINIFGNLAEDEAVTSTGSYRATAPNSAGNWVMQLATFRTSGEGGSNPAPTVSGISPTSGTTAGGTAVTITGTGFLAGATVSVGGTAATGVHVVTSTSITAVTPGHSAGAADVTVTNTDAQHGTLSQAFTYTSVSNPLPTVTAISPNKGSVSGGTAVTITGTGFQTGASVTFGGTLASIATMVNNSTNPYCNHAGTRRGRSERGGYKHRRAKRHASEWIYLRRIQSRANCSFDRAEDRPGHRWNDCEHHRRRLPDRSNRDFGWQRGFGRQCGERPVDYRNHSVSRRRNRERCGLQQRRTERNAGEWLQLRRGDVRVRTRRARGRFEFGHGQCWADSDLHSVDRRRWVEWHSSFHLRGSA